MGKGLMKPSAIIHFLLQYIISIILFSSIFHKMKYLTLIYFRLVFIFPCLMKDIVDLFFSSILMGMYWDSPKSSRRSNILLSSWAAVVAKIYSDFVDDKDIFSRWTRKLGCFLRYIYFVRLIALWLNQMHRQDPYRK